MHPSELAELTRSETWNHERLQPEVAPGSMAEAAAIAAIDEARDAELERLGDTFAKRRARSSRYWGRHHRRGGY